MTIISLKPEISQWLVASGAVNESDLSPDPENDKRCAVGERPAWHLVVFACLTLLTRRDVAASWPVSWSAPPRVRGSMSVRTEHGARHVS